MSVTTFLTEVGPPADPSGAPVVSSGLVALAISAVVWPLARYAITVAHEGGHAWTASMMGGKIELIKINRGGGGHTDATGLTPFGNFLTGLAGYLGPSVFGLAGAFLLVRGHVAGVLWISLVLLFLALVQAATWFTRLSIAAVGAAIVLVLRYATPAQEVFFAYTWIWFLLFGGFAGVLRLQRLRADGKDDRSDAYQLRKLTYLPASLWSGFFWLITLAALVAGAAILLGFVRVG